MSGERISLPGRRVVIAVGLLIGFAVGVWLDYAIDWSVTLIGFSIGSPPRPTIEDYITSFVYLTFLTMFAGYCSSLFDR